MRKPPLAHCTIFLVAKRQLQLNELSLGGSDKMYFNQKIIVINNCPEGGTSVWRRFLYTNNECLFFTWSNPMLFAFFAARGGEKGGRLVV